MKHPIPVGAQSPIFPLLVIVGQTAAGKSSLAIELAKILDGEIICADSWTVRSELSIGTAKPSPDDRRVVPHHLLDIVAPDEDFSAALFKDLALRAIQDIGSRGKLPILVGGTGLYIDGILFDYGFLPAGDAGMRPYLNALTMEQLLREIDARSIDLHDIDVRNKRRLIRLLETNGTRPTKKPMRKNTLIVGVMSEPQELHRKIIFRTDEMLERGLEEEVRNLGHRYGWECEGLKGIGYREWKDYFEGSQSLEITRQRIIQATIGLAKRQRTWFKRNKSIHWYTSPVNVPAIVDLVTSSLNK